eukprot:765360-Amphidinium_carterae.1
MAAVVMGDLGAATVVQEARSLAHDGGQAALHLAELIGGSPEFAWKGSMGDLVLIVLGLLAYPPDELRGRLCELFEEKDEDGQLDASFGGASLRGKEGIPVYSVDRRSSLPAITLLALAFGPKALGPLETISVSFWVLEVFAWDSAQFALAPILEADLIGA